MPKMKSHRGAAARVKVTASGRLRRRQQMRSHLLEHKSASRKRRLGREVDFAKGDEQRIKRMLGR